MIIYDIFDDFFRAYIQDFLHISKKIIAKFSFLFRFYLSFILCFFQATLFVIFLGKSMAFLVSMRIWFDLPLSSYVDALFSFFNDQLSNKFSTDI